MIPRAPDFLGWALFWYEPLQAVAFLRLIVAFILPYVCKIGNVGDGMQKWGRSEKKWVTRWKSKAPQFYQERVSKLGWNWQVENFSFHWVIFGEGVRIAFPFFWTCPYGPAPRIPSIHGGWSILFSVLYGVNRAFILQRGVWKIWQKFNFLSCQKWDSSYTEWNLHHTQNTSQTWAIAAESRFFCSCLARGIETVVMEMVSSNFYWLN
jgi:hypothetical protein